mmetsp:Transcript_2151/g.4820  ORF Transcript_2151/g.4820 Transcript_2151/m.4820 type:complete len:251 (+) Transcript_2151:562-1314(+)
MAACASRSLAVSAMRVAPGPLVTRETRRSVSLRLREWRKSKLAAAASLRCADDLAPLDASSSQPTSPSTLPPAPVSSDASSTGQCASSSVTLTAVCWPRRCNRSSACAIQLASGGSSAKTAQDATLKSIPSAAAVTETRATRTAGSWRNRRTARWRSECGVLPSMRTNGTRSRRSMQPMPSSTRLWWPKITSLVAGHPPTCPFSASVPSSTSQWLVSWPTPTAPHVSSCALSVCRIHPHACGSFASPAAS